MPTHLAHGRQKQMSGEAGSRGTRCNRGHSQAALQLKHASLGIKRSTVASFQSIEERQKESLLCSLAYPIAPQDSTRATGRLGIPVCCNICAGIYNKTVAMSAVKCLCVSRSILSTESHCPESDKRQLSSASTTSSRIAAKSVDQRPRIDSRVFSSACSCVANLETCG